jgi:hypothetical protein
VRVEGVYRSGVLAVEGVEEAPLGPAPPFIEPPVPCPAPLGGWQPWDGFTSSDQEIVWVQRLGEYVQARADQYTELWEGHPTADPPGASVPTTKVMVVGTTGNVASARAELGAIYSGNLCVHQVRHSRNDLQRIADRLMTAAPGRVEAVPLAVENRVRVTVAALDVETATLLDQVGRDSLQLEEPVLQWRQAIAT